MFLAILLIPTLLVQTLTISAWLDAVATTDAAGPSLRVAGVWYGAATLTLMCLSSLVVKAILWVVVTTRRPEHPASLDRFRRWGMDKEAVKKPDMLVLIVLGVWSAVNVYLFVYVAMPAVADDVPIMSELGSSFVSWLGVSVLAGWLGAAEYLALNAKRRELDDLRLIFHTRFPVSEILSMYECLRAAPRVFWEEYTSLPAVQVNEATNRKFRERVGPYATHRNENIQRTILAVAAITVLVTLVALLSPLIGDVSEWVWELMSNSPV